MCICSNYQFFCIGSCGISVSAGGVDYSNVDLTLRTLTFTSSVTSHDVDIPIRDDLDCEIDETIRIELTTLDNDVTLDPRVGCVTIEDDGMHFLPVSTKCGLVWIVA